MNKLMIPVMVATLATSASSFAHGDRDGDHRRGHDRHYRSEPAHVYYGYRQPMVIYQPAPVIYRQPIAYNDRYRYRNEGYRDSRYLHERHEGGNRLAGQALGAVAGAIVGNQLGQGEDRAAATIVGAVIGGAIGGNVAR